MRFLTSNKNEFRKIVGGTFLFDIVDVKIIRVVRFSFFYCLNILTKNITKYYVRIIQYGLST